MMRAMACGCVIGMIAVQQPAVPAPFEPVGKWSVSTTSDEGQAMTASVDISGKPGSYTGQMQTSLGRVIPIRDIMTSPTGMIIVAELPQSQLIVRVSRDSSGQHTGEWGEVETTYRLRAERRDR